MNVQDQGLTSSASTKSEEQVGVGDGVCCDRSTVGRHYLEGEDLIDPEAKL